jgi:hypothetical protein
MGEVLQPEEKQEAEADKPQIVKLGQGAVKSSIESELYRLGPGL